MCSRCKSLALTIGNGSWVFYQPPRGACTGLCDLASVSVATACQASGLSEEVVLKEAHRRLLSPHAQAEAGRDDISAVLREVEGRLGLSQPADEGAGSFTQRSVDTVHQALSILLAEALPATPVANKERAEAQHRNLMGSGWGAELLQGSKPVVTLRLKRLLERDAGRPGFRGFTIDLSQFVPPWATVSSSFAAAPGQSHATANVYAVWRTAEGLALCGSAGLGL
jgi:hypothetical protein